MLIDWRNREYDFTVKKLRGGKDSPRTRNRNIDATIFGADTEQVELPGGIYETQCYQLSTPWDDDLYYIPNQSVPLFLMLEKITEYYGQINNTVIIYMHNLEYDWCQMVKYDDMLLEMQKIGVSPEEDMIIYRYDGWTFTLKGGALFTGSAPHCTIYAQKTTRIRFTIQFRDTSSFFPGTLSKMLKDLKLGVQKMERQLDIGKVDYRTVSNNDEDKKYFEEYSIIDAKGTRLAGEEIRKLHHEREMQKIRVSAPAYAINSLLSELPNGTDLINGVDDTSIMQLIFDTYRGGRTGGCYHGRVFNISVFDFRSSYPASMRSLPSFTESTEYLRIDTTGIQVSEALEIMQDFPNSFARVSGYESDHIYPALITIVNKKLTPIAGKFVNIASTGVEIMTGVNSGSLRIDEVLELVILSDNDPDVILPFQQFADNSYKAKASSEKGTVLYTAAKIRLNSAYGKLIESRFKNMISSSMGDYQLPYIRGMEAKFASYYLEEYLKCVQNMVNWDDYYLELLQEFYEEFEGMEEETEQEWFSEMSMTGKVFGQNVIPAAASLITATSRARLYALIKSTGALYWDTDSAMIQGKSNEEIISCLKVGSSWLPEGIQKLSIGDNLGDLDCEMVDASGYLAGTKRYYLTDGEEVKRAVHGMPALPYDQVEHAIRSLATGENFHYISKERPLKSKESKSVDMIGAFRAGEYESIFRLDIRQEWEAVENGQLGKVKEFNVLTKVI